jgi:hypothetical protein
MGDGGGRIRSEVTHRDVALKGGHPHKAATNHCSTAHKGATPHSHRVLCLPGWFPHIFTHPMDTPI